MIDGPRKQVWLLGGGLYSPQVCMDHLATEMLLAVGTFNIDLFACVMSLLWACVAVLAFAVQHSLIAYKCPSSVPVWLPGPWICEKIFTVSTHISSHEPHQLWQTQVGTWGCNWTSVGRGGHWWMTTPSGNDNNEERYVAVDGEYFCFPLNIFSVFRYYNISYITFTSKNVIVYNYCRFSLYWFRI